MIKQYLQDHYNIGRLYNSYLISTDDIDLALSEVQNFIYENILTIGDLSDNPDYMYVEKIDNTSKNISIDQVRKLQDFLHKTSVISGQKIAVIYAAEKMNINAANCCLKILEEPPSNTHLFLLTENAASLLPTIRSRCIKMNHHYDDSKKNQIDEHYIKHLHKSNPLVERLGFIKEFAMKDRDIWIGFSTCAELLLLKFCRKMIGLDVQLSKLEQAILSQFKSSSLQYLQAKYEDIKQMVNDVNEFDLDLRAACVLLIEKFRE